MSSSTAPRFTDPSYLVNPGQEVVFVLGCMFTQLFYQAAITNTLTPMNVIASHFNATENELTWSMAAVPLATGTLVLATGRIGDIYGLKKVMLGGYIWAVLWALLSGIAYYSSAKFFIVARVFQGVGIAFIIPNMMGLAGSIYTPRSHRKNVVFSLIGASAPIGAVMGAFWSGLIVQYTARFDWCMYAYSIAMALAGLASWYSVPDNVPVNPKGVQMDWWGSLFGVTALVLFNFVWNQSPSTGFDDAYIIVLLVVSVVLLIIFAVWEDRFATFPLIPRSLKTANKLVPIIFLAMFLGWGSFGVFILYYFRFVTNFRHYGPLHVAWSVWPALVSGIGAAGCVGYLFRWVRVEIILLASMIAFLIPCILLAIAPVGETYFRDTMGALLLIGFGMDLSYPASSIVLSDTLPPDCQGVAGSLTNTIVGYSMSIFLGFGSFVEARVAINGASELKAFRSGLYFAIGCAGLAVCVAGTPVIMMMMGKTPELAEEMSPMHEDKKSADSSSLTATE